MCGIAGKFSREPAHLIAPHLKSALQSLQHRGPDGESEIVHEIAGGTCALGHRRLSIIDLSNQGRQPMVSGNGRYTITFNGEIYNYRELKSEIRGHGIQFHTDTDTEVLLEAWSLWGPECLNRLIGMFAFVIEDKDKQSLECVRDAFGIKPLFYDHGPSHFAFASEVAALRHLNPKFRSPNAQRSFDYLSLGRYDDKAETFFEGILQLEPGTRLTVQLAKTVTTSIERWWRPSIRQRENITFANAVDEVRELFLTNVQMHLRSDVPLGAALSGGIDSSALVCAMRHLEPSMDLHTFSYVASEGAANEESWINSVNAHTRAISHKVTIEDYDLSSDIDDLITIHGEPFGSTSIYAGYRIFKKARETGIVVCLDGQGADEMFAGYHGYPQAILLSMLENGQITRMARFLGAWADWPGRMRFDALQRLISEILPHRLHGFGRSIIGRSVDKPWLKQDVLRKSGVRLAPYPLTKRTHEGRGRRLAELERSLLTGGGLSHLLRHGDRNSMRWSVESRVPFLTAGLAEMALSLPESFLVSDRGETKSVFRAAMRGIVPDSVIDRRDKVGFETPELRWLNSDKLDIDSILEPAAEIPFLDVDQLRQAVNAVLNRDTPFSWQAWRIINYCKWAGLVLLK